jgi:hypothetical protein
VKVGGGQIVYRSYREKTTANGNGIPNNGHVERERGGHACLLQKVCGGSANRISGQCLDAVDANANECPQAIDLRETCHVGDSRVQSPFMLRGDHHQSNVLVDIEVGVRRGY